MESAIISYQPIPGLATSDDVTAEVNGQNIWVEKYTSNLDNASLPGWFTGTPYTNKPQQVDIVNFACSGRIDVTLTVREPIETFVIRPKSRQIRATKQGRKLTFSLPAPDKLYIEINDLPPICFFANPIETSAVDAESPNVTYFAPGVHSPGEITLKDDSILYISGGAVVYGALHGSPKRARIMGHGVLDGGYTHRLVRLRDARDVEFSGVLLRNGRGWQNTLTDCRNIAYRNVKVISFGNNGDGINPVGSRNVTIDDCFLRCTDDCIAVKSPKETQLVENIKVINSTMIGYAFSDGMTIGFETNGPSIKNVLVKNCDILLSRGRNRAGGHSGFSIICDGAAWISDIRYEDIRVEQSEFKLFELTVTDGTLYGENPPGHIKDIHLKNVSWETRRPIVLQGLDDEHLVENVVFENCSVAGKPLRGADEDILKTNQFVRNVTFK